MAKATEVRKADESRQSSGFYTRFMSGSGLDIGYRGYGAEHETVLSTAVGVDSDFPNYDGFRLPFPDESQDYVFASHVLEHISRDPREVLGEWFRVVKTGGHLVIAVPHAWMFEKKLSLPSRHTTGYQEHVQFFTSLDLVRAIQESLQPNTYRIVHMAEIDEGFNYNRGPEQPPETNTERYEIECVVRRINPPSWRLA